VTHDAATWVIASLEMVGAIAFTAFWLTWFRQPHDQEWLPSGYREHESPFVFSDSVLAVLLAASAVLLVLEQPLGSSLSLVAGGGLGFLGVLDAAYFWRTGLFARDKDGVWNLAIVAGVLTLAGILIVRFA
jgi:hypothetical protein